MSLLDAIKPVNKEKLSQDLYALNRVKEFKPLLESIMHKGTDAFVDAKIAGYTPKTLYVYLNHALRDLCAFSSGDSQEAWRLFRKLIKFKCVEGGVYVFYSRPVALSNDNIEPKNEWRESFVEFIEEGKVGEVKEFSCVLEESDIQYVKSIVEGAQGEVIFEPFKFKVIL